MKKPMIYLCGPIHGLSIDGATGWRTLAAAKLAPEFEVLDPTRNREWSGTDYSHFTDNEIVDRDLMDIRMARAVLRYFPIGGYSEGSPMETFFASFVEGIPVVTFSFVDQATDYVVERDKLPVWTRRFTVKNFTSLDEAVDYLKDQWLLPHERGEQHVPHPYVVGAHPEIPRSLPYEPVEVGTRSWREAVSDAEPPKPVLDYVSGRRAAFEALRRHNKNVYSKL